MNYFEHWEKGDKCPNSCGSLPRSALRVGELAKGTHVLFFVLFKLFKLSFY